MANKIERNGLSHVSSGQATEPARCNLSSKIIVVSLVIVTFTIALPRFPLLWDDSHYYIAMATGDTISAVKPFSDRILLPLLARGLMKLLHLNIDTGFEIVAIVSLFTWFAIVVPDWRNLEFAHGYLSALFLISPLLLVAFETVHIPDMLHMAAVALFFYAIRRQNLALSALITCALITIRESSVALAVVAVVYFIWNRQLIKAVIISVAVAIGATLVHNLAPSATNVHNMPDLLYMALKMPANFLHNVFGISLWTDGFHWCEQPIITISVPKIIDLGRIHEIGFCRPSLFQPMLTLASLTAFGILPAFLVIAISTYRWDGLPHHKAWWAIAFWYGALMTLLGPLSGTAVIRLIGYGWPLFFIALPVLYSGHFPHIQRIRWQLIGLHAAALWLPYLILEIDWSKIGAFRLPNISYSPGSSLTSAMICLTANVIAFRILRSPDIGLHTPAVRQNINSTDRWKS